MIDAIVAIGIFACLYFIGRIFRDARREYHRGRGKGADDDAG